jgi:hypothetical protein
LVKHTPAAFDSLWRSGALLGLVVTLGKRGASSHKTMRALASVPRALCPAAGQPPWYATSPERQQAALFVAAHLDQAVAARLERTVPQGEASAVAMPEAELQKMSIALRTVHAAALQLSQPPLRALLELAAPALLPLADQMPDFALAQPAVFDPLRPSSGGVVLLLLVEPAAGLLMDLGRQLDPLALGLALPGCYNPACTSLAGAGEAGMKLKRCAGCQIARWAVAGVRHSHVFGGQLGCRAWLPLTAVRCA